MTSSTPTALAILAHPDDVEFTCAGTLALLRRKGWDVHIATMTPGQCGSGELPPAEIAAIRRKEAAQAAATIDGAYTCLECEDFFLRRNPETVLKVIALVRQVQPTVVFAHPPLDYISDHETSSLIVRDAAFWAGVPNIKTPGLAALSYVPHLYYVDPMEGKNLYGETVMPRTVVDISEVIDTKQTMLVCHASQREWLMTHHGIDEYTAAMRSLGQERGALIGCAFGEGLRQHLGHGYPQNDLLAEVLGVRITAPAAPS
ncbi:MAG: PIG-L family deacetylase [Lentisphaerae bacterium]|nr:PIG-L family deacetylase [Lentisphaerota bacterium]